MTEISRDRSTLWSAEMGLAIILGGILLVLLFPLPPLVLDLLIVCNISFSFLLLLLMFYVRNPLDLGSFPSLLLINTLFRLSLNVASTKLILLNGGAGTVINAFGHFVAGNNYVVGVVVFLILVMVQFMVITKGAGRIAEVAARFTLDAMPGKQMSIDADLNAGIIDENEARERRQRIADEAEFYGAMDGASKFVKGDAIAGLVITGINILGGLTVGVLQNGMQLLDALQNYTLLTIGDGLVSQIPALVVSVASGILVTKTATKSYLGEQLKNELFNRREPLLLCAGLLVVLGLLPGLPFLPFTALGIGCFMLGKRKSVSADSANAETPNRSLAPRAETRQLNSGGESPVEDSETEIVPRIQPMALEVGFSLVPLLDATRGGDLVDRIGMIRKQIGEELGFLIPAIQVRDNIALSSDEYRIMVRGLERTRGIVHVGSNLAIDPGDATGHLDGIRAREPAYGLPAVWISPARSETAESMGYTVVDAASVVATHVTKTVREHAAELLSRQDVSDMLERLKTSDKAVVEELVPDLLGIAQVHRVLQFLLQEEVPIHDLPIILETLADMAPRTKEPNLLCEFSRQGLRGHIVNNCLSESGTLHAVVLNPELELEIKDAISEGNEMPALTPERISQLCSQIADEYGRWEDDPDIDPVLLVSPVIRRSIRRLIERKLRDLPVLSYSEVPDDVPLEIIATLGMRTATSDALTPATA